MSGATERCRIVVAPEAEFYARRRLFEVMSDLYGVDFVAGAGMVSGKCDGAIVWGLSGAEDIAATNLVDDASCLVFAPAEERKASVQSGTVCFDASSSLDLAFRKQTMREGGIDAFSPLRLREGDDLFCTLEFEPYWALRRLDQTSIFLAALAPEELNDGETIYAHFNRQRWLRLLPLLHFLKQISRRDGWEAPPIRACLMFDDPNLHAQTYGHIDFVAIAKHAQKFAYHVSFAMVPFDTWHADASAVEWVKQNHNWVSLCMHGNNHARMELALPRDETALIRLFAQGLQRVSRFEERTGVAVSRVMVPPYEAFADRAVTPMVRLGYEAVCVSRSSLSRWNKERMWNPDFGHSVTELIDGLPVIPRHVMAPGHEGSYRLAAFLDQPIIPHGHHQDCANGLGLVEDVVSSIYGLGEVTWMDMTAMSRSNYLTKREDQLLRVKMLARRVSVPVPDGVSEVVVERPWIGKDEPHEELQVSRGRNGKICRVFGGPSVRLPCDSEGEMELASHPVGAVDFRYVQTPRLALKGAGRRLLAETRDRLLPLLPKRRARKAAGL